MTYVLHKNAHCIFFTLYLTIVDNYIFRRLSQQSYPIVRERRHGQCPVVSIVRLHKRLTRYLMSCWDPKNCIVEHYPFSKFLLYFLIGPYAIRNYSIFSKKKHKFFFPKREVRVVLFFFVKFETIMRDTWRVCVSSVLEHAVFRFSSIFDVSYILYYFRFMRLYHPFVRCQWKGKDNANLLCIMVLDNSHSRVT